MSVWLAALIAVGAVAATYFFCIRPMRSGGCAIGAARQDPELARQVADLREEVRVLRAEESLESGRVPSKRPEPPTGV
jgi:hypothetical protein